MADTVRKKKLTIKAQRPAQADGGTGPVAGGQPLPAQAAGAMVPVNPMDQQAETKAPSYTLYAILAVLACLCYVALILLQWMEWSYYAEPPSLWPR